MKQWIQRKLVAVLTTLCLVAVSGMQAHAQAIINTFAGNGTLTYTGDNGPSNISGLNSPFGACVDKQGNVYITDGGNNRIRKVDAITGIITTVAGNGNRGFSGDGTLATSAELSNPQGVAVDTAGNLYIADTYNYVVRKVTKSTGIITTIAGIAGSESYSGDGQLATNATIDLLIGIAVDDSGNVFIADHYSGRIREISSVTGIIRTMAGGGSNPGTDGVGDGGPGSGANFNQPDALAIDDAGNMYVADQWHHIIRKIMAKTDSVFCVAGTANSSGYTGDGGLATLAQLAVCSGVAVDVQGNVFIADTYNNVIRRVAKSTGIITTIAGYNNPTYTGTGNGTYSGDGGHATAAQLNQPYGVTVDWCGNVYAVDNSSGGQTENRVRIIYIPDTVKSTPNQASVCNGNSVTLTASGATYYTWAPSAGLSDTTLATVNANPSVSTTYTLKGGTGCAGGLTVVPALVPVSVGTGAPLIISPANPTVCPNQQVTLSVNGGGSSYKWSPSTALNKTTGDSVVATGFALLDSIVYTVTDTPGSGCAAIGKVTLRSGGSAIAGKASAVRDTICEGTSGSLTLAGNSSSNIQWQSSTDSINFTNAAGDTSANYKTSPLKQTTWYRATVGAGSCSAISNTLELYVPPALIASFYPAQTTANGLTFNSDSSSGKIRSYHWDFGDGGTSTDSNPSHTYAKDSTYYVCLTLYDGSNCSYTFCRYSEVTGGVGVPAISATGNWVVYPNPFSEQLIISAKQTNSHIQSIEMYDVLGRLVVNKIPGNTTNASLQLDVSSLAKGMYYVMIRTADADYVQKVVKQ